jgi:hypothetical protein
VIVARGAAGRPMGDYARTTPMRHFPEWVIRTDGRRRIPTTLTTHGPLPCGGRRTYMESVSRRSFLSKSSIGAAATVGALSLGPGAIAAAASPGEPALTSAELAAINGPLFVHIRDAATGEIEVMVGETSVVFKDKALVAKVLRASK